MKITRPISPIPVRSCRLPSRDVNNAHCRSSRNWTSVSTSATASLLQCGGRRTKEKSEKPEMGTKCRFTLIDSGRVATALDPLCHIQIKWIPAS